MLKHSTFTHVSDKTAKEGPGKKPWADKVGSDKNLDQLLPQYPQKADEGHIQEAFHWKQTVLKYLEDNDNEDGN